MQRAGPGARAMFIAALLCVGGLAHAQAQSVAPPANPPGRPKEEQTVRGDAAARGGVETANRALVR